MAKDEPLTPIQLEVQRQLREFADDPTDERARALLVYVRDNNGETGFGNAYSVSELVRESVDGLLSGEEVPKDRKCWKYFAVTSAGTAVETTFGDEFDMHETEQRYQAMTCVLDVALRIVEEHKHKLVKRVIKQAIEQTGLNMKARGTSSIPSEKPGKGKGFAFNLFKPIGDA